MALVALFLRVWQPGAIWTAAGRVGRPLAPTCASGARPHRRDSCVWRAWTPWVILSVVVFVWGLPSVKAWLDAVSVLRIPVPGLHEPVMRVPPVVPRRSPEAAVYAFNWLSATGSGIFVAAIMAGLVDGLVAAARWRAPTGGR